MSRKRTSDKALLILEAAIELFPRYGYRRTSVEDIAREAGIAKGTIYLYFSTKQEIFREASKYVVERFLERSRAAAEEGGRLADRLQRILDAKFGQLYHVVTGSPHAAEILDYKNRLSGDVFLEGDIGYQEILALALTEAQSSGEIDLAGLGTSARELAGFIFRCAEGCGIPGDDGKAPSLEQYEERLRELVTFVAAAVEPRAA